MGFLSDTHSYQSASQNCPYHQLQGNSSLLGNPKNIALYLLEFGLILV